MSGPTKFPTAWDAVRALSDYRARRTAAGQLFGRLPLDDARRYTVLRPLLAGERTPELIAAAAQLLVDLFDETADRAAHDRAFALLVDHDRVSGVCDDLQIVSQSSEEFVSGEGDAPHQAITELGRADVVEGEGGDDARTAIGGDRDLEGRKVEPRAPLTFLPVDQPEPGLPGDLVAHCGLPSASQPEDDAESPDPQSEREDVQ